MAGPGAPAISSRRALAATHPDDEPRPLAEAKLAAPRQRSGMLVRPRLEQLLEAGADAALTLVAAPAGIREDNGGARLVGSTRKPRSPG